MKPTQKDKILMHLKSGEGITSLIALRNYGCFHLATCIFRLRGEGYKIRTTMIRNANGNLYAYYQLIN